MPASTSTVTLDQAKDWSKRLVKATPAIGQLADAQAAVAVMLGHASWHALQAFYKRLDEPAAPTGNERHEEAHDGAQGNGATEDNTTGTDFSVVDRRPAKEDPFADPFARYLNAINAQYPELNAVCVEMVGSQIEVIGNTMGEVIEEAERIQWADRALFKEAVEQAMEECSYQLHAPPGHFLVRLVDAKDQRTMAVLPYLR